jgi:hypothetical protein
MEVNVLSSPLEIIDETLRKVPNNIRSLINVGCVYGIIGYILKSRGVDRIDYEINAIVKKSYK